MGLFGHLPEILVLLVVALLVFGPKRMIEMGSALGKALRELREATKEMTWPTFGDEPGQQKSTVSKLSQLSQTLGTSLRLPTEPGTAEELPVVPSQPVSSQVVEGSIAKEKEPQDV